MLARLLSESTDAELFVNLLVRASFDQGPLRFRIAEFVDETGTASQRAIPFFDGESPAEVDVHVRGRTTTYQANVRGGKAIYSPIGFAPSIVDTVRQEDPTVDFDVQFPRPDLRPRTVGAGRWGADRDDPDRALIDRIATTPHPVRRGKLPRPPGLHRVGGGRWIDDDGEPVTDPAVLERLRSLAIPPAWVEVWASADPTSRVQATGVDSRNRTQYRYSDAAVAEAAENKFAHMIDFARHLPRLRAAVAADLGDADHDSATRVAATVVRLLDRGLFRVGNAEYARDNHTHGLTTLARSDVAVAGETLTFDFVGKEHLNLHLQLADPVAAKFVRQLLEVDRPPDSLLFVIEEEGALRHIDSATVNAYIHMLVGAGATAKTFRTWGATAVAAAVAGGAEFEPAATGRRKPDSLAYAAAAHMLGNTPAVARQSYVHPDALSSGRSAAVRAAVERAADQNDTRDVRILFHDEELQQAIWRDLPRHAAR
nr:hypothetical protein [Leifsonia shinshuensis]